MVELIFIVGIITMYALSLPYGVFCVIRDSIGYYQCKCPFSTKEIIYPIFLIVISSAVFVLGFFAKSEEHSIVVLNISNGLMILMDILCIRLIKDSLKPKAK